MKKVLTIALLGIVLVSGCVGQGGTSFFASIFKVEVVGGGSEDMIITAEVPEYARENKAFDWNIIVKPGVNVQDFRLNVFDRCEFAVAEGSTDAFGPDEIEANHTKVYRTRYRLGDVTFEKDCPISFKATYTSNLTLVESVITLEEQEYFTRERKGTLGDLSIYTYSSVNPLQIDISFSDPQPLLEESEVQMYLDYRDRGSGIIESLGKGDVTIMVPGNLQFLSCDGNEFVVDPLEPTHLVLDREKRFTNKRATRTTCTFTTLADNIIDSRNIAVLSFYDYSVEGTVSIPILAK